MYYLCIPPLAETFESVFWTFSQVLECWSLHNITNVTFTSSGIGTIDGSGDAWSVIICSFLCIHKMYSFWQHIFLHFNAGGEYQALVTSRGERTDQSCSTSRTQGMLLQSETCQKSSKLKECWFCTMDLDQPLFCPGTLSFAAWHICSCNFNLQGPSDGELVLFGCSQVNSS